METCPPMRRPTFRAATPRSRRARIPASSASRSACSSMGQRQRHESRNEDAPFKTMERRSRARPRSASTCARRVHTPRTSRSTRRTTARRFTAGSRTAGVDVQHHEQSAREARERDRADGEGVVHGACDRGHGVSVGRWIGAGRLEHRGVCGDFAECGAHARGDDCGQRRLSGEGGSGEQLLGPRSLGQRANRCDGWRGGSNACTNGNTSKGGSGGNGTAGQTLGGNGSSTPTASAERRLVTMGLEATVGAASCGISPDPGANGSRRRRRRARSLGHAREMDGRVRRRCRRCGWPWPGRGRRWWQERGCIAWRWRWRPGGCGGGGGDAGAAGGSSFALLSANAFASLVGGPFKASDSGRRWQWGRCSGRSKGAVGAISRVTCCGGATEAMSRRRRRRRGRRRRLGEHRIRRDSADEGCADPCQQGAAGTAGAAGTGKPRPTTPGKSG